MQGGTGIKIKKVKILCCMNLENVYQIGKSRTIEKAHIPIVIAFVGSGIPWIVIEDVRYASA